MRIYLFGLLFLSSWVKAQTFEIKEDAGILYTEDNYFFTQKINLNTLAQPKVSLINEISEIDPALQFAPNLKVLGSFEPQVYIGMERKQAIAYINVPKFIIKNGQHVRLKQFALQILQMPTPQQNYRGSRVYAANSVLGSGNFYKITIDKEGLYKLDYNFIKNTMKLDPSTINPQHIRLYGNGGTMLYEDNAVARHDDLVENAIEVVDGGDGSFDNGDYMLFYATGPHEIVKDSVYKRYGHRFNLYSDVSAYFLNFDKGPGKRIAYSSLNPTPSVNVNSYNHYDFHEVDLENVGKLGKLWWGELFADNSSSSLVRTFDFNVSDVDASSPTIVSSNIGGLSFDANSQFQISANGTLLRTVNFNKLGTNYFDPFIDQKSDESTYTNSADNLQIKFAYSSNDAFAKGYLDFVAINCRRNLVFRSGSLKFCDFNSVGSGNVAHYSIQNPNGKSIRVWDITNPLQPIQISLNNNEFNRDASRVRVYYAFDGSQSYTPQYVSKVDNQDLHDFTAIEYVIVTAPEFIREANRLAEFHRSKHGTVCKVVTTAQIYNEFSSGTQDISSIRDYVKMLYDKADNDPAKMPRNVLLFGDGSYDYKNRVVNNGNYVPAYETFNSSSKIYGYVTDDFFGMLDDVENIISAQYANTLDVGVGRFPVNNLDEAKVVVDKIIHYSSPKSFGAWRNNQTFCADNRDPGSNSYHMDDAESVAKISKDSTPVYNQYKIYVDAFELYSTPNGYRAPQAKQSLDALLYGGTLTVNYNGHGGYAGWCEERILYANDISGYVNYDKLSFFVTATCDFAKFDEPDRKFPAERLLLSSKGGAVGLMSTSNLVFQYENKIMNTNYFKVAFTPMSNGEMPTLGDAFRLSKNLEYTKPNTEAGAANFRKFVLLGDPQLTLAFPMHRVSVDSINGKSILDNQKDTLKALGTYTLSGHVSNKNGSVLNNFNGFVDITIFDKEKKYNTIPYDGSTLVKNFYLQNNSIFKGKVQVVNGYYSAKIILPKDIDYSFGKAKVSLYAYSDTEDANGFNFDLTVGGASSQAVSDNQPPLINLYMNNTAFRDGGTTGPNPIFLMLVKDETGINTSGNSPGHDLSFYLDDKIDESVVLNNFYEASATEFGAGQASYPLSNLSEGEHTITAIAWDILNNSSKATLNFIVADEQEAIIKNILNVPNPFVNNTEFCFEHNQAYKNMTVNIQIISMDGRIVKEFNSNFYADGFRVKGKDVGLDWNGKDLNGDDIGKGVFVYKVTYKTEDGKTASGFQKLLVLR